MKSHTSTSTIDRSGRASHVPWNALESRAPTAFVVAGASLLASLFAPLALATVVEWSWLVGIALVGFAVVAAALGLLGLHSRTRIESPWLATAGAMIATAAGVAGLVVLALAGLTGGSMHVSSLEFSVSQPAFVVLSLTMATGYGLGFLVSGTGLLRSRGTPGRAAWLLTAGGIVLLVPVVGGILQLGAGIAMPAWVVFASLGLVAVDTVTVGLVLRSTN